MDPHIAPDPYMAENGVAEKGVEAGIFVAKMHRNFTGVSATAAAVIRQQTARYDLKLVGGSLPGCPQPISIREAFRMSRRPPPGRHFSIWHVRRNEEMLAAIFARDVLRLPIRIVFTSSAQRRHSAWPRLLISRMDAIIATTPEAAEFVTNVYAVVPHGVDVENFWPAPSRALAWAETGYPGSGGIATIGRIRPEKGTDRFVRAMIRALPNLPGMTALVIGKATSEYAGYLDGLKREIAAAGMSDRFLFTGEIAAETMPATIRALSLLVAAPRYEGYGVTPLEAMASGVPFVATDAGGFRTFSGDGAAGIVVEQPDPDEICRRILAIVGNPERHQAMALAARYRAETEFSVAAEARGISAVYDRLWAESARTGEPEAAS